MGPREGKLALPGQGHWEGDTPEEGPPWACSGFPLAWHLPSWQWIHFLCSVLFLLPQLLVSSSALTHFHPCLPPLHNCPLLCNPSYARLPSPPRSSHFSLACQVQSFTVGWAKPSRGIRREGGGGGRGKGRRRGHSSSQQGLDEAPWKEGALEGPVLPVKPWPMACCQGTQAGFLCLNFHFCKMGIEI